MLYIVNAAHLGLWIWVALPFRRLEIVHVGTSVAVMSFAELLGPDSIFHSVLRSNP